MISRRPLYAYYYPAHHRSDSGWFEWDLVRGARPWFDGHAKPDVPLWGELDDSLPATLQRQVQAAWAAGIDGLMLAYVADEQNAVVGIQTLEELAHLLRARETRFIEHVQMSGAVPRLVARGQMPL